MDSKWKMRIGRDYETFMPLRGAKKHENPPKSPFKKGGLQKSPPLLKGGKGGFKVFSEKISRRVSWIRASFILAVILAGISLRAQLSPAQEQPSVHLAMPKTTLFPGDSLVLTLSLGVKGLNVNLFFYLEVGSSTFYLNQDGNFSPTRAPVPFPLADGIRRIFGPQPSILGEVIIPAGIKGSFSFVAELVDPISSEILKRSKVSFTIKPASVKLTMPRDYLLGTENVDLFLELRAGGIKFDLYLYLANDIDQISLYHGPEGDFSRKRVPSPLKLKDGKVMLFGLEGSNPSPLIGELWLPHHGMGGHWTWTTELVEPGSGEIISKSKVSFFVEDLGS